MGLLLERLLSVSRYLPERLAVVFGIGSIFSIWLLLLSVWILGFKTGTVFSLFTILVFPTYFICRNIHGVQAKKCMSTKQRLLWLLTTLPLSVLTCILLYRFYLMPGPGGAYSFAGSWGDLPLHLGIMSSIARMTSFHFQFSLMSGTNLTYPFLIDFASGMIQRLGATPRQALLLVSVPLCLSLIQLIFFLVVRLTGSFRAASISVFTFILSGSSFGFLQGFHDLAAHASHPLLFLRSLPVDYSNTNQYGFGTLLVSILLPQRSFQFGFVVFAICASLLVDMVKSNRPKSVAYRIVLGALIGSLPLAHAHTFFVVLLCIFTVIGLRIYQKKTFIPLLQSAIMGILLALPQLYFQLVTSYHSGFVRFHPGWMFSGHGFWQLILYVAANFGLTLALAACAWFGQKQVLVRGILLIAVSLLLVSMLFIFQPAEYDNIKFLIYAHLLASVGIGAWLAKKSLFISIPAVTLLVVSGTFGILYALSGATLLYPAHAFAEAEALKLVLPADAIVLTSDFHEHPLWGLAGQPTVRAYSYWLWSYGLPAGQRSNDVDDMYMGKADALSLLHSYSVGYVLISPYERKNMMVNEEYYRSTFTSFSPYKDFTVYTIK